MTIFSQILITLSKKFEIIEFQIAMFFTLNFETRSFFKRQDIFFVSLRSLIFSNCLLALLILMLA